MLECSKKPFTSHCCLILGPFSIETFFILFILFVGGLGQRPAYGSWSYPLTTWLLGIKLGLLGLSGINFLPCFFDKILAYTRLAQNSQL